jgi:succinate dehydrogenase flavin-adding protein (antitoxin of CptAB toxin-antitoxin module)
VSAPAQQLSGEMRLRKLHWLVRRGMKELDILLEAFIIRESLALLQGTWPEFEALLRLEDDRLWDFIRNPVNSPAEYQQVLKQINHDLAQPD